jgi:hypothetical protein
MTPDDLFRRYRTRILALAALLACSSIVAPKSLLAQGNIGPPALPAGPPAPAPPAFAPRPFGPSPANNAPIAPPQAGGAAEPGRNGGGLGGAEVGAIVGAILGALIGLVLWALRRAAKAPIKVDPATGGAVVEFSRGIRSLTLGFSLFTPAALLVAAFFIPAQNSAAYVVIGVAILLFAGLGPVVCWALFKARFIATSEGLIVESGWKRRRLLPWRDVVEVVHDKRGGGLLFRGPSAKSNVSISPLMAGLKPLVAVMRQHLPADRYARASDLLARFDRLEGGNAMPFLGALDKKAAS